MAEKIYYSMGEVSEMFDVKPSLIRYWCNYFKALKPRRNNKGNRLFTPEDVETLKLVYHLVKERGMTLEGASKALKARDTAVEGMPVGAQLLERLQKVRAMLLQVRDLVGAEGGVQSLDDDADDGEAGAAVSLEEAAPGQATAEKTQGESADGRPVPFYEQTLF